MSEASTRAAAFVAAHEAQAQSLATTLVDLTDDAEAFCAVLEAGLRELRDPAFARVAERVSPNVTGDLAVRGPLLEIITHRLDLALREGSSMDALRLAQRLIETPHRDLRLFALPCLRRAIAEDPELTWQLMRRMAHRAGDWVEVDGLAEVWARGVLAEPFRWAELEQLVYAQQMFERRLVGATLATMPKRVAPNRRAGLRPAAAARAFPLIALLMGDAEEMVQRALSWAVRAWTQVDAEAAVAFLRAETAIAVAQADGSRAWVIRDALSEQPPQVAAELRGRLAGLRRDRGAPSSSIAAEQAAPFAAVLSSTDASMAGQGQRYTRNRA